MIKTYTFTLPKKENSAKKYKDSLIERAITAYPWLTIDSSFDYPYSNNGVEFASAGDIITVGLSKTHNISWLPENSLACKNCAYADLCNSTNFDLETEFLKAINALDSYAKTYNPFEKDYDFKDIFGTPVKIFDNFVQIGYEIIPISSGCLNYLKPKTKKLIIDLTIKIKTRGLF